MQAGGGQRAAGFQLAGDIAVVERALRLQGDHRGIGIVLVALLDRRLQRAQFVSVHDLLRFLDGFGRRRQHPAPDHLAGLDVFDDVLRLSSRTVLVGISGSGLLRTSFISSSSSARLPV